MTIDTNILYYGDNLEIMRKHIPDNSVDLIYLDPPFNSKATYNVLFKEPTGKPSQAQMEAFEDSWHWGLESEKAVEEIINSKIATGEVKELMSVLPKLVGQRTDMLAYLTMMCIRLIELKRVLKDTGSIYLHCDPTASHYLKILMDAIFSVANFRNEIVWKRSHPKGHAFSRFASDHDVILMYVKESTNVIWNSQYAPYDNDNINDQYSLSDSDGRRYQLTSLLNPNPNRPNLTYEFKGVTKVWRWTKERMLEEDKKGRIIVPKGGQGIPRYKRYLDEQEGIPVDDFWDDIELATGTERLGYPTQKPEALLERIIKASSNEGDIVLDPFCGCGTAIVAAQKLNRKWIGIDITHLAIGLMKWRLKNIVPMPDFKVIGEPKDLASAVNLANNDKYQFQWWVVSLIGGQPYGDKKKGADSGIDGLIYYMDEREKVKKAIISVKGGENISVSMIRDLGHVIDREKADIGIFITIEKPTRPMIEEAAQKGFYHSPLGKNYPRLQILTLADIFNGKSADIPPWIAPITASKNSRKEGRQIIMEELSPEDRYQA